MKLKTLIIAGAACLCASPAIDAQNTPADSLSMAVGTAFGHDIAVSLQRLRSLGVAVDVGVFLKTVEAELKGETTAFTVDQANAWLDRYIAATRPDELPDALSVESQQAFVDSIAALPGAVRFPDGLVMIVELEGEGAMPSDSDIVRVMYTGRFFDGVEFDATTSPIEFKVTDVTPGFSEGLRHMKPGGRYRLVMPSHIAYGPEGIPGAIPGNAALDFTVDLVSIKH